MASRLKMMGLGWSRNVLQKSYKARTFTNCRMKFCTETEPVGKSNLPYGDRDPAPYFFHPTVQELLYKMTGMELDKIYAPKQMKPGDPQYQFVTGEELKKMMENVKNRGKKKIQFPPVVQERKPINEILSQDRKLQGFEDSTLVFTDVTYGISEEKRTIVARDPDGTLRRASWDERFRMNQIFFPRAGRELTMPKMFEDEYLKRTLNERNYRFVLDRACVQFAPDDPNYIRVTCKTYDHIDSTGSYDVLRSTRHFGPMAFYLTFYKRMDKLLIEMINRELIDNAADLIRLFHISHPKSKSAEIKTDPADSLAFIRAYTDNDSSKRTSIGIALRSYTELQRQKIETAEGVKVSHGYTN